MAAGPNVNLWLCMAAGRKARAAVGWKHLTIHYPPLAGACRYKRLSNVQGCSCAYIKNDKGTNIGAQVLQTLLWKGHLLERRSRADSAFAVWNIRIRTWQKAGGGIFSLDARGWVAPR
eukprot:2234095-Pyramimonas_sp.AAC.1